MTKRKKAGGVAVMLDAELTDAVRQLCEKVIRQMNDAGVYGAVAAPSMGYVARQLLRSKLGLSDSALDDVYQR
ncbi:hypothetical protein CBJ15_15625 [Salmonella enterica subsp. enterica serovar Rubislaw]|uniref:Uncharacterized protein n=1 Tax=Salmonella rubislaw TaxID=598 RepID=A0A5W9CP65_SALRU|nr:hypothetical protein [Salmonella enterica]EBY3181847.1 hypothetical protein [Salmonella enterica subsp. enterica serovar Rubislaw]EEM8340314.1 hypothetical protein [Salmonella enterica subsp. enterica serovar Amager]EHU7478819.1 hypothetical protein [Salmonella enterica]EHV4635092.1 hypothetical protein [Salmonella enterica]